MNQMLKAKQLCNMSVNFVLSKVNFIFCRTRKEIPCIAWHMWCFW